MNDNIAALEPNSMQAVLRLLLFTTYSDRVKKPEEMAEVFSLIGKLAVFTEDAPFGHPDDLGTQIQSCDAEIRDLMDASQLWDEISNAIAAIDSPLLIPMVLDGMKAVAEADGHYHHSEDSIIRKAAETWGWDVPE